MQREARPRSHRRVLRPEPSRNRHDRSCIASIEIVRSEIGRFALKEGAGLIAPIGIEGMANDQFALEEDFDHIATLTG